MPVSRKELIRKFRSFGFTGPYSGGKHQFMVKEELKVRVPNPHQAGEISDSLLREILRQAGISKDDWKKV
jgi:predicted RNA binding protein YcfA (HicA-like mRNA interferase family)